MRGQIGNRGVIVAEDRGQVFGVASVGGYAVARLAVNRDPVRKHLVARRHVEFETGEAAIPLPPELVRGRIASDHPYEISRLFNVGGILRGARL